MMFSKKWVVLWSLWAARLVRQPTLPVRLPGSGALLRGQVAPDGSHSQYFGIPYATVKPGGYFKADELAARLMVSGYRCSWTSIVPGDRLNKVAAYLEKSTRLEKDRS